jgi:hypothetical protein
LEERGAISSRVRDVSELLSAGTARVLAPFRALRTTPCTCCAARCPPPLDVLRASPLELVPLNEAKCAAGVPIYNLVSRTRLTSS